MEEICRALNTELQAMGGKATLVVDDEDGAYVSFSWKELGGMVIPWESAYVIQVSSEWGRRAAWRVAERELIPQRANQFMLSYREGRLPDGAEWLRDPYEKSDSAEE